VLRTHRPLSENLKDRHVANQSGGSDGPTLPGQSHLNSSRRFSCW